MSDRSRGASDDTEYPQTWMDSIDEVLDEAVTRDEGLELTAEDLRVEVPLRFGEDASRAEWGFDGSVRIDVEGERGPLAEWLRLWESQLPRRERTDD
ncbi:MAG: hypothetical protein ABEJ05_06115 [Haloglomus sp.]